MSSRTSSVFAALVLATGALAAFPSSADACSCMQPSLSLSWHDASDTFKGVVRSHRVRGNENQYTVEVIRPFSGCTVAGDVVMIESNVSSAACGMQLQVGEEYLLTSYQDLSRTRTYDIGLCGYNREWSTLSQDDRDFLRSRPVVCSDTPESVACADGSAPVACFADSCDVVQPCGAAATCEFNTCGGCTAEFYDEAWNPVCL